MTNSKSKIRTLNVIQTTITEITEHWGFDPLVRNRFAPIFIRCNSQGEVNWKKAPLYHLKDFVGKRVNFVSVN